MSKRAVGQVIIISVIAGLLFFGGTAKAAAEKVIDQEKLNRAVGLHIEKNMPWVKGSMRFEILTALPQLAIPEGKVTWKVESRGNEDYLGETNFVLKLYNNGVLFREEPVRARIEVLREFVVSTKNMGRNHVVAAEDISLQKRWVRSIPLNSISDMNDVIGKSLCLAVRPNTEITGNMLKAVNAVTRGRIVQVVLDSGAINITTMGMAEEDGVEGSFVRVRNISSNKIIYARVVGESKVKVDF
ncbi:MAG TPA: flagellar basal body P-ring formation chaperone FlgA [Smithellaceae bacterium]|nr:flagellar basal body P-ring formation chaperone FlgA [Smithellaceae bacterium]